MIKDNLGHVQPMLSMVKKKIKISLFYFNFGCTSQSHSHQSPIYISPVSFPPRQELAKKSIKKKKKTGAFEMDLKKQELTDFMPSRLFLYYNERVMEGTVDWDAGFL